MEPATIASIASAAVGALVPLLSKGAEKLVEKGTEEAYTKRAEIWNKVKGLFAEDDLTTLNLFENDPENAATQGELRGELKHLLKANPEIAEQLDELLKQLPKENAKNNTLYIKGNNINAFQDISDSKITIKK
ncbi:MAG: hypothetical protein LUM44_12750 [Pyrinomonadaceae bacterium]|nr:hypothetical protein [Pyrinomonadaceae bacterium]